MKVLFKTRGSMNISERAGLQRDFFNKYNQRILKSTEKKMNCKVYSVLSIFKFI